MKRYSEYKDSGVKWIGEIPGHWKMPKLNRVVSKVGSGSTPRGGSEVYIDEGIKFLRSQNIHFEGLNLDSVVYIPDSINEQMKNTQVQPFDVLLNITGGSIGRCFYVDDTLGKANVNQHVCIIRPLSVNYRFLKYFLQSNSGQSQVWFYQKGDREGLSAESIKTFRLPLPPLPEQQAIVTYLDTKVAKIDEYISIAEKKIAALEELKQSIIAEAVTRGIHKEVPMKDSGVKWIGMIPEHWKIMRLRFVCEFRNGYTPSKANPKFWENGTIPWFRMEDIRDSGRFLNEAKQYISKEAVKGDGLFEAGSFILATTATIGEHAMLIADSLANQRFTNLKIRKSLISKLSRNFFFYYLFVIDEYCKSTTRKATFPSVDMTDLKNIGVSIPPIEEQQEIVTYLDSKVANINQLCQAERSQIEKLKEYKQRLISDVVTGKVKVTND